MLNNGGRSAPVHLTIGKLCVCLDSCCIQTLIQYNHFVIKIHMNVQLRSSYFVRSSKEEEKDEEEEEQCRFVIYILLWTDGRNIYMRSDIMTFDPFTSIYITVALKWCVLVIQ